MLKRNSSLVEIVLSLHLLWCGRFAQPYWGKGLATEVASAWVRTAFDESGVSRLGAFVHPENAASIRVLEKVGFRAERHEMVMGVDSIVFSLDAKTSKGSH